MSRSWIRAAWAIEIRAERIAQAAVSKGDVKADRPQTGQRRHHLGQRWIPEADLRVTGAVHVEREDPGDLVRDRFDSIGSNNVAVQDPSLELQGDRDWTKVAIERECQADHIGRRCLAGSWARRLVGLPVVPPHGRAV